MSEPTLKPCPFCGVKPKMIKRYDDPYVSHHFDCYFLRGDGGKWIEADAIAAWNRRTP